MGMIAQYQREVGFTAILVSHEIPDVYFISNRILALYDGSIIFQGTPEEFENFDHPFKREVIHSLEGLQKNDGPSLQATVQAQISRSDERGRNRANIRRCRFLPWRNWTPSQHAWATRWRRRPSEVWGFTLINILAP